MDELPLADGEVAGRVEVLLDATAAGNRAAACALYACLHEAWGQAEGSAKAPGWDAVLRYLLPRAVERAPSDEAAEGPERTPIAHRELRRGG